MAKIIIAELDIDVKAMIASTSQVKKVIDDLKSQQDALKKSGDTNSKGFIENAANLKVLNSEYTAGIKALADNTKATADQANRTELLKLALDGEVTSIAEAREQNKLLNKLRNEANATTIEGQAEIKKLNNALDANNEFIKENADAYLKQKINIGNYSDSIKDALQNLNPFNGGIAGFTQRAQEAGGAGNLMKTSLQGVTSGVWGMIKASLAFIATPIGAVIAVVAGAALILYNVFAKLDPVMDKIEQLTAGLGGAFAKAQQILVSFVSGLTSVGDAFTKIGNLILHPIDSLKSFGKELGKAAGKAADLKAAEQDLGDLKDIYDARNKGIQSQINLDKIRLKSKNLTGQQEIEIEKRINDNYEKLSANKLEVNSKTLDQVISYAITNQTGLKKISNETLANEIKNGELKYANFLLNEGRITKVAYDKLKESVSAVADSNNQLAEDKERTQDKIDKAAEKAAANAEKAQADALAMQQKQADAREKAIDDSIAKTEQEFALLQEKNKFEADSIEKQKMFADAEIQILNQKLKNKRISQTEYDTEKLKIENDLKQKQTDNEVLELERVKVFNDKKNELENQLELNKLTDQTEKDLLKATFDLEKHLAELENIKTTEAEKNELRKLIMLEYNDQVALITDNATNERLKKQGEANVKELEFEKTKNDLKINLAGQLGNTLLSILGDSLGAQLASIAFDAVLQIAKMRIATASAQQINLANATAMGAPPINVPFIAAAVAQNLALGASSKLNQTGVLASAAISGLGAIAKKKFEKGGIQEVGGNRHAQGGTKFVGSDGTTFEAEKGEGIGVLNRGAFSAFMDFNNNHSSGGSSTPTFMAGGGIITQGVQSQSNGLDMNAIIDIISSMPAPVVAVTDIHTVSDNYVRVVNGADF